MSSDLSNSKILNILLEGGNLDYSTSKLLMQRWLNDEISAVQTGAFLSALRAKGCAECRNTGYKGRLAIFEMIPMAKELRKLVFNNANEDEIRQTSLDNGMTTLRDAGLARVLDGTTSIEEIMRSTVEDL